MLYVAGTTPVKFSEFFVAHFIGTFKVALLDAYLGSLLLQSIQDTEARLGSLLLQSI
ncbi:hypothetical protein T484DRAFT_1772657 [Baffinella frigidus]|nr:hypothetical protein T484DRAFT_1772657 [Cryptophyta sp. CCMP2293]